MKTEQYDTPERQEDLLIRLLRRIVDVKPEEIKALTWSCLYYFCILSAYYVIRPIRDEMGVAGGVGNLPWLFAGTLACMLALNPLFSATVAGFPRRQVVALTYRFFMANLVLFFLMLQAATGMQNIWVGRIFFIWTAVFNLFVVSIFWAFMADIFTSNQGRRLFGFIGAGGTMGGILGSSITVFLVRYIGTAYLLLISMLFLEVCVKSAGRLARLSEHFNAHQLRPEAGRPIGGNVFAGLTRVWQSPYLLGICAYMLLFTILSTFLYFEQADIVGRTIGNRAERTALFARIDLWVNILTLATQVFLTGRIIKALGVAVTLIILPLLTVVGFAVLGFVPALSVIVIFQVLRRAGNFAVARPTREILFTVLAREDKYKAKNFIDTVIYRLGDQAGAWTAALIGFLGLGASGLAFAAVPISLLWLFCGFWLGRKQEAAAGSDAETCR